MTIEAPLAPPAKGGTSLDKVLRGFLYAGTVLYVIVWLARAFALPARPWLRGYLRSFGSPNSEDGVSWRAFALRWPLGVSTFSVPEP